MKFGFRTLQAVISLLITIIFAVFISIIINKSKDDMIYNFGLSQGTNTVGGICSGTTVKQTFVVKENYFCRLDILLSNYGTPDDSETIIELLDENDAIIFSEKIPVYEVEANSYRTLKFDSIKNSKGKLFTLILKCEANDWEHSMTAWCTENDEYIEGSLNVNGDEIGYDIVFKMYSGAEGLSNQLLAASLICVSAAAAVILFYHILIKKHNNKYIKLICWTFCSFFVSMSIVSVYLKLSGIFIDYSLFDVKSIVKAIIILPYIMILCSFAFYDLRKLVKKDIVKKWFLKAWKAIYPVLIISGVFCFMLLIYEPILIYATNINDFKFDLAMMLPSQLLFFAIGFVLTFLLFLVIYLINNMLSKNLNVFYCIMIGYFVIFFATYIQGNWLAGDLPVLMGDTIQWDQYFTNDVITLLIWTVLIIIAICITVKFTPKRVAKAVAKLSVIVFVMLSVGIVSSVSQNNAFKGKGGTFIPTMENYNTLSSDKNFLIFLVDTVDSSTFKSIIDANDEYNDIFKDFTYFSNAMSSYPFTLYSIPNILTGTVTQYENDFIDYCNEAYNNSPLFKELTHNNYDINIYSQDVLWSGIEFSNIRNDASPYSFLDAKKLFEQEIKYISFKYLPYAYKKYSQIETVNFNAAFECTKELYEDMSNEFNYQILKSDPVTIQSNPVFQFIHTAGAHPAFTLDKDLNAIENGTYEQEVESCITLLKTYIQRLKDNGAYDNSVIIFMSDHGFFPETENPPTDRWPFSIDGKETLGRLNPLFMIKGVDENHESYIESDLPISYWTDLQEAYKELLTGSKSTELFSDMPPIRKRKAMTHLNGIHLEEFETEGKAWEWEKFKPTGNIYELK